MISIGNFTFIPAGLEGAIIVDQRIFPDERGYFLETYYKDIFWQGGIVAEFVQDNQSRSRKGVLRGMHFQTDNPQGKLVRVISGEIFDIAVDLRADSSTYGKWIGIYLSDVNRRQLYMPAGFAHGFLVTGDEAEVVYRCTDYYNSKTDGGIRWNDPDIGICWPLQDKGIAEAILSEKDRKLPLLKEIEIKIKA